MGSVDLPVRYVLLHPDLANAPLEELLQPELCAALQARETAVALRALAQNEFEDVYSFPLLRPSVCVQLREEAEAFRSFAGHVGIVSPGLLLSARWYFKQMDSRYDTLFDRVVSEVLRPIDNALYGDSAPLTYHHDYCICYEEGADRALKPHTDDSDVTVNIFLGAGSEKMQHRGAELLLLAPTEEDTCCGTPRLGDSYRGRSYCYTHQEVGRAVLHPGDRWHAVQPLECGSRWNLLTWAMRADTEWKRTFYEDMEQHLRSKAEQH